MTCRTEILAAAAAIVGRSGVPTFSPADVVREMRRRGSRYLDSTIRAHIIEEMWPGPSVGHPHRTSELVRVERGVYRLADGSATAAVIARSDPALASTSQAWRFVSVSDQDLPALFASYLSTRDRGARYASFDYCYNHFQRAREMGDTASLAAGPTLEVSCLHLGFYLASWGMLRGSGELFHRSLWGLAPVVECIASEPASSWDLDVDRYESRLDDVVALCERVRSAFAGRASDTLVTKAVLGVFGAVPAFDRYFRSGFEVSLYGRNSLRAVGAFYRRHREVIDALPAVHTFDFATGADTHRVYSKAKVLDMVFFERGRVLEAAAGDAGNGNSDN